MVQKANEGYRLILSEVNNELESNKPVKYEPMKLF